MLKLRWDNPQKTIVRLDYFSPIHSWDEYRTAVNQANYMATSVDHRVHVIHNSHGVTMPSGDKDRALEELNKTFRTLPQNVDLFISVTSTSLERRITRIAPQISARSEEIKFVVVDSLDKAYEIIEAYEAGHDIDAITG